MKIKDAINISGQTTLDNILDREDTSKKEWHKIGKIYPIIGNDIKKDFDYKKIKKDIRGFVLKTINYETEKEYNGMYYNPDNNNFLIQFGNPEKKLENQTIIKVYDTQKESFKSFIEGEFKKHKDLKYAILNTLRYQHHLDKEGDNNHVIINQLGIDFQKVIYEKGVLIAGIN